MMYRSSRLLNSSVPAYVTEAFYDSYDRPVDLPMGEIVDLITQNTGMCVILQLYHQRHVTLTLISDEITACFPGQLPDCTVVELRLERTPGSRTWETYYADVYTPSLVANGLYTAVKNATD